MFVHRCTILSVVWSLKITIIRTRLVLWFAGDEKTRQMAIVLTQQTDFLPTARKLLKIFVPITTRASNTRGFAESDLINLIPNRICDCMVLLNHTTLSYET